MLQTSVRGFSLPEVVMAMGIAALAISVILGLMPAGLESIRTAGNIAAESSIFRQLFSEVQSADWGRRGAGTPGWSGLSGYQSLVRYYDDQGTSINSSDSSAVDSRLSYVARISFPNLSVLLPGASVSAGGVADMVYLKLEVAAVPLRDYNFDTGKSHRTRTMVVARQH